MKLKFYSFLAITLLALTNAGAALAQGQPRVLVFKKPLAISTDQSPKVHWP
ncbi:hypothetical protein [Mucilaginibacter antarcticus]|uniref:hypothetical protein n=1 Tax=Mucilaginibacter antarcticus TaxID=1855725 RepID=UPI00363F81F7